MKIREVIISHLVFVYLFLCIGCTSLLDQKKITPKGFENMSNENEDLPEVKEGETIAKFMERGILHIMDNNANPEFTGKELAVAAEKTCRDIFNKHHNIKQ